MRATRGEIRGSVYTFWDFRNILSQDDSQEIFMEMPIGSVF